MSPGFRDADHLPQRRPDGEPADPRGLPRQRRGITPQMHGRHPDFDVLAQAGHWDEVTRRVVLDRVHRTPPIRFFAPHEAAAIAALADVITAQDSEPRIPVVHLIDDKLLAGRLDGYQYADMPDDREAMRLVARGLDDAAAARGAVSFADLTPPARLEVTVAFAEGGLQGGVWDGMPIARAWPLVTRMIAEAFYSHPWSWNEIGFGGPAYPRGYLRVGVDQPEPWEGREAFSVDPVRDARERGLR